MNICALMVLGIGLLCTPPNNPNQSVVDTTCRVIEVIRWSRNDTDETIIQVKEHNAVLGALCDKKEEPDR